MPLADISNPAIIKFYNEEYEKNARLRMKWNKLHAAKLKYAATFHHEEKGYRDVDVLEKTILEGLPTMKRDHTAAARNRRIKPTRDGEIITKLRTENSIINVGLGNPDEDPRLVRPATDLSPDPPMRPVDEEKKSILYKNLPDFGRKVYLKNRNRMKPDEKYYFSECSGWVYGWRGGDSFFSRQAPMFGRRWSLTRDAASRTGPQPNPTHYRNPEDLFLTRRS